MFAPSYLPTQNSYYFLFSRYTSIVDIEK
jgi:hypothetical protein